MASKSSNTTVHPPQKPAPRSRVLREDAQPARLELRSTERAPVPAGALSPAGPRGPSRWAAAAGQGQRRLPFLLVVTGSASREVSRNEAALAELPRPRREPRAAGSAGPFPSVPADAPTAAAPRSFIQQAAH